jgi:pimeloyl-ACP methyl ester carboxylesterase
MTTFVLVHGAWHGGWVYARTARILRSRGHDVFTPTLTGVGERAHLAGKEVNLSLHILDVCNVLRWENLEDVVLCGHSYGGIVVTGVADAMPERIRSLVCVDAFVPENGKALWDYVGEPMRAYFIEGAGEHAGRTKPIPSEMFKVNPDDIEWVKSKVVPMAMACFLERIRLTGNHLQVLKRTYVYSEGWSPSPFTKVYERLRTDPAWTVLTSKSGHHVMLDDPEGFAEMLLAAA